MPLAFAPFDQFWLAPLCYAVLFGLWRGQRPRRAFWLGLAFGVGAFTAGTYWTYISVHDFGQLPALPSAAISGVLIVALALFFAAAGAVAARWFPTAGAWGWLAVLPAVTLLTEWSRGWVLTGFGWLSAGYSQTESWLMGYAPVLGQHGMGWAVYATAGALVALVLGSARARIAAAAVIALVWGCAALLAGRQWTEPREEAVSVALLQGAVEQDLKWRPEQLPPTLELYRRLTEQGRGSDLIVWPEAAIPALYEQVQPYLADLQGWSERNGSTVLVGILRGDFRTEVFQNVLVALTEQRQVYVKRHLVPFGEYFPVPDFVRNWMRLMNLPYTDLTPGDPDQPALEAAGERIAVTICYEDVFGEEQLGYLPDATLLVNVSNEAWFGDSIAPHQHLQIARLRAAEAGRYLLRATNTGITAVIDPLGRELARLPQFEPGVLRYTVRGHTGATPYARWGNWPVLLAAFAVLAAAFLVNRRR
ncbi:MAG TPA: apolipoprotein N-acyltransferase [Gammaproteobacteria bacterium]